MDTIDAIYACRAVKHFDPKDMGYDSCPMIGFDIEKVADLINLPEGYVMGPIVAIGKGIKAVWPKPGQLPLSEVVIENSF